MCDASFHHRFIITPVFLHFHLPIVTSMIGASPRFSPTPRGLGRRCRSDKVLEQGCPNLSGKGKFRCGAGVHSNRAGAAPHSTRLISASRLPVDSGVGSAPHRPGPVPEKTDTPGLVDARGRFGSRVIVAWCSVWRCEVGDKGSAFVSGVV